jgi:hypothetical protein
MKRVLELQIKEKKQKNILDKEYDKKYEEQVKSDAGNYHSYLKNIEKNKIDQKVNYKKELDCQIKVKSQLESNNPMNQLEKGMNRDILDKIFIKK